MSEDKTNPQRVIIIGTGMAGLSAALELKKRNIPFIIIEAGSEVGGRAKSITTESGNIIDTGAHWCHPDKHGYTPLCDLINDLTPFSAALETNDDTIETIYSYDNNGLECGKKLRDKFDESINYTFSPQLITKSNDLPLSQCVEEDKKQYMEYFLKIWFGTDSLEKVSLKEYLHDTTIPGGLQFTNGVGAFLKAMANYVGMENILLNTPVTKISTSDHGICVTTTSSEELKGDKCIFTGSLAVLKSDIVKFNPPLSAELKRQIDGFQRSYLGKIIIELNDTAFFKERNIHENTHIDLPYANPALFCHANSVGKPLLTILFGGREDTLMIEGMTPNQARDFVIEKLKGAKILHGFENKIHRIIVSKWTADPYIGAAYSIVPAGFERTGPRVENNGRLLIAGDTFDTTFPATMAGAHLSGKAAARII